MSNVAVLAQTCPPPLQSLGTVSDRIYNFYIQLEKEQFFVILQQC